jgi:gliding motility-associated-like protein
MFYTNKRIINSEKYCKMKKLYSLIFIFFLGSIAIGQTVTVSNITRSGRFQTCGGSNPTITATMITSDGSTVENGNLVITDPCGFTTLRINMSNLKWNKDPGTNWFHGVFFPENSGVTISGVVMPAGWSDFASCTGASCSAGETGGQGFYFDGTVGNSCTECYPTMNDGLPFNNYGDDTMGCNYLFEVQFEMTFCNSQVETTSLEFALKGKADGNTGCWSVSDNLNNEIKFTINTVASDIPLYAEIPDNTEVITECEDGGATLNYIAVLEAVCGTGEDVTWWDAAVGGNQIGVGSPFLYDPAGNACPQGMILYASCCPDGQGCERQAVVVGPCLPPSDEPIFNPIPPQCPGLPNPLPSTSLNGATGSWSPAYNPNATTTYTFTPDLGQCVTQTAQLEVEILPTVEPLFNPIPPQCPGMPNPLPTTSLDGYTGVWVPAFNPNATTTYTFVPDDACAEDTTLEVIIEEEIVPDFILESSYCQFDENITLPDLSNNGYTGVWAPSNIINTNIPGTYTYIFTPTDFNCFTPYEYNFTINPFISPEFNEIEEICQNTTPPILNTTSLNGVTGTWNPSVIDTSTPGIYTYVFTPNESTDICSEVISIEVEIIEERISEFNFPLSYCQGESAPILSNTSLNGVTGVWVPSVIDTNIVGTSTYTFIPDDGQCALDTPFEITIHPELLLNTLPVQEICDEDFDGILEFNLTSLNASLSAEAGVTYQYYGSLTDYNNNNPIPQGQWFEYPITGTLPHTIYVVGVSAQGCPSDPVAVQIDAREIAQHNPGTYGPIEFCANESVDLTQYENNISTANVTFSYFQTLQNAQNQTGAIQNITDYTPTGNVIYVRIDQVDRCPAFVQINLSQLPTPSLQLSQDSVILCYEDSTEITAISDDPNATFEWTFPDGSIHIGAIQTVSDVGNYTVVAYSPDNCESATRTFTVSLPSQPIITGIDAAGTNITVNATNNGEGPMEYSLDGTFWQTSPLFSNLVPGETYTIWVRSQGCMIEKYTVTLIFVPNFISPNNDGINDTWTIRGIETSPNSTIKIFDRYGKIFVDTNFEGNYTWNGKYLGNNVPSGDYWYIINVPGDGVVKAQKFTGHITVRNQ